MHRGWRSAIVVPMASVAGLVQRDRHERDQQDPQFEQVDHDTRHRSTYAPARDNPMSQQIIAAISPPLVCIQR